MSRGKFVFRFAVVKQNLLRHKKVAEANLMQCRAEVRLLREKLNRQQIEYDNAATHWSNVLVTNPNVSIGSLASYPLEKNRQTATDGLICDSLEKCRQAEVALAQVEQKLSSIEEIENMDFAEYESARVRREENTFRDEILSKWNQE